MGRCIMIQNIVFDMGRVLLNYTPQEYMKTITEDEVIAAAVFKELFNGKEWIGLDAGTITEEDAVKQVSLRIPAYAHYVEKAMENWHTNLTPISGMQEILKRLKGQHYKLYLLSNTSLRFFKFKENFELFNYFDGFLVSAQEKLMKPDKAIFDRICSRYSLHPDECLFIDDLQPNIEGAIQSGFHAHLFTGAQELCGYLEQQGIL